ncbi:MAG: hypothetical protein AAFP02_12865 [Bacteroidota bacterium]
MQNSLWTEARLKVYSDFFAADLWINLVADFKSLRFVEGPIVSETMTQTINDFLNWSQDDRPKLAKLLYDHCRRCCEEASYGVEVREGESETEANLREFGVSSAEDAFREAGLPRISIEDDQKEQRKHRYVTICFYPPWEQEHGCELVLQNGSLLDYAGEHGTYLRQFE